MRWGNVKKRRTVTNGAEENVKVGLGSHSPGTVTILGKVMGRGKKRRTISCTITTPCLPCLVYLYHYRHICLLIFFIYIMTCSSFSLIFFSCLFLTVFLLWSLSCWKFYQVIFCCHTTRNLLLKTFLRLIFPREAQCFFFLFISFVCVLTCAYMSQSFCSP